MKHILQEQKVGINDIILQEKVHISKLQNVDLQENTIYHY